MYRLGGRGGPAEVRRVFDVGEGREAVGRERERQGEGTAVGLGQVGVEEEGIVVGLWVRERGDGDE